MSAPKKLEEPQGAPFPLDDEGYARISTDLNSDIQTYGLAVRPILEEKELQNSLKALWEENNVTGRLDPEKPETWENENWPDPDFPFLSKQYAMAPQAFQNRVHPKVRATFATLYGTEKLGATIDFWGVKRGTVFPTGNRPDWRPPPLKLHWDVDLRTYHRPRYQGLLALTDCSQAVGSFAAVPGSHRLKGLAERDPKQPKYVRTGSPWQKQVQRLPLRAGHLIVWDMAVAHCNFANYSHEPRLVQFIRLIPREDWAIQAEKQNLKDFWTQNPQLKQQIGKLPWTREERECLFLR